MFHLLIVLIFFIPKGTEYNSPRSFYDDEGNRSWQYVEYDPPFMLWITNNAIMFLWIALWSIPLLGLISFFRRLEDGFQTEDDRKPVFSLKWVWITPFVATSNSFKPFIERLKWEWFWRTWMFYPALLAAPLIGAWVIISNGVGLFMDVFFLRCWDQWYYAINEGALAEKTEKRRIRGSRILELGKAAGAAPIDFVRNKLSKRELEKDLEKKKSITDNESESSNR